jgi:dephospho-CoA kinase
MLWIGLTGGIACGKSSVTQFLRDAGYAVVDADVVAREVVAGGSQGAQAIKTAFGPGVFLTSGELDRKKIASLVFDDPSKLKELEAIIHPLVQQRTQQLRAKLAHAGQALAFYDVPLLFEKNLQAQFDHTVVVTCDSSIQLARLMKRNGLSETEAKIRIASQLPLEEKLKRADDCILNNGSLEELKVRVQDYLNRVYQPQT